MKPSLEPSYTFEARIEQLRSTLSPFSVDGTYISPEDIQVLLTEIEHLRSEAAAIRNELSVKRWNDRDQIDELKNEIIRQAMEGNVRIFPVMPKPIPHDALQSGVRL